MAFGFPPKYTEEITSNNINDTRFYSLAIIAAKKLNWDISALYNNGFSAYTKFSMSSWSEEVHIQIENGKISLKSECTGNQIFDWGKNKENIADFKSTINKSKKEITDSELDTRFQEIKKDFIPNEELVFNQTPLSAKEKIKNFYSLFLPTEGYFITPILLLLNIIVFIIMIISGVDPMQPDGESLILWGANFRPTTINGGWWRLISSCFLHIGVIHLLMNMYALLYIGLMLEPYLGKVKFLNAYLLSGIAGSVASIYWNDPTISAGASGAIFGMYGVFLAMLTTNFIEKSARKTLITSIFLFVAYNLLNGMKDGIDNAAHIGGLISGIMIGYSYYPDLKKQNILY
ncbi:MAG: rhomboid family intramembrane serine protease [Vicingaceae bacterium]|nr:rhomboid family intramembrane serine protease [Vicingaceae bacterium]